MRLEDISLGSLSQVTVRLGSFFMLVLVPDALLFPAISTLPELHRALPLQGGQGDGPNLDHQRDQEPQRQQLPAPQRVRQPGQDLQSPLLF